MHNWMVMNDHLDLSQSIVGNRKKAGDPIRRTCLFPLPPLYARDICLRFPNMGQLLYDPSMSIKFRFLCDNKTYNKTTATPPDVPCYLQSVTSLQIRRESLEYCSS